MRLKHWLIIMFRPSPFSTQACSVVCSLDNPLEGFARVSAPNGSLSRESGPIVPKPNVRVTCLLTRAAPSLHRGLRFVTVFVTLSAALMGYQAVHQPLWIEGSGIQPGVKVLSGPFDLSQISSHVIQETACPKSDTYYKAHLTDLHETPDSVLTEEKEVPDMRITYCFNLGSGI